MTMAVTTTDAIVQISSGAIQVGLCAIDANVDPGDKRAPEIRPSAPTSVDASRGAGRESAKLSRLRVQHIGRGNRRRGDSLDPDVLPLEVVGDGEMVRGNRLAVSGECL